MSRLTYKSIAINEIQNVTAIVAVAWPEFAHP